MKEAAPADSEESCRIAGIVFVPGEGSLDFGPA
jgi:hypothetical protein